MAAVCDECWNDEYGVIFAVEISESLREEAPLIEHKDFHLPCLTRHMLKNIGKWYKVLGRVAAGMQQEGIER